MQGTGKNLAAVAIFFLVIASPHLINLVYAKAWTGPNEATPRIQAMADKECIEAEGWMRRNHMDLLLSWRDAALRDSQRIYENGRGERYDISLMRTCLGCHSNRAEFCDRCHAFAAVEPYCWQCHYAPTQVAAEGWP